MPGMGGAMPRAKDHSSTIMQASTDRGIRLSVDCAARITFASAQNAVPILREISIRNQGDAMLRDVTLHLRAQPAFCRDKQWRIDRLAAADELSLSDLNLTLDIGFLDGLNEAERGQLVLELRRDGEVLADSVVPIELLARDEWGGLGEMAQILAAFVSPNDPAIAPLLKAASTLLEAAGHPGSLEGYQRRDPARVYMLAAAIWSAVTGMGLAYAEPPRSFEQQGQKIRDPGRIADEGLATCLDTALLFAAALEATGLNPAVIFTRGHAFVGVWLVDGGFAGIVEPDITELRKAIAAREFVVFETTLVTARPVAGFEQAIEQGRVQLDEAKEADFKQAIDMGRARAAGIRPLASHRTRNAGADEPTTVRPAALPTPPDFDLLPDDAVEEMPRTPQGRIERWQRKLLDLSLRNRLLNFSDTKQTVPFLCPDVARLEDRLSAGEKPRIISLVDENPVGDRDPRLYLEQTGEDINLSFARQALAAGRICVSLTERDMTGRLTTLFRKAKSDLAEGGTNTLFLAAGFLRWKKSADDQRVYRAPLLLLPVKLERRSSQSSFRLAFHEDEVRFNATLLQFLERDFGLKIPALQGELPTDAAGIDLPRVFAIMRQAVREVAGFEVVEDLALSTFSFAKYLMWKDLVDRTDSLRKNRLVRHLIDHPEAPFSSGDGSFPRPEDIDRRLSPADLFTPLPADSSQLSAVVAAAEGHDFVIVGPPGTGKSQTIANMIAHCLALGKSVLFVAEKSAALDVVYRRLRAYGLGDACLELHSNKADRRTVIAQLGAAWDRAVSHSQHEWIKVTRELELHRDQLNAYVAALHAPGTQGVSVFEAIGKVVGKTPVCRLRFAGADAHDARSFADLEALAALAGRTYAVVGDCRAMRAVAHEEWSFAWQVGLLASADVLRDSARECASQACALAHVLGLPPEPPVSRQRLATLARFADAAAMIARDDFRIALNARFDGLEAAFEALTRTIEVVRTERARLAAAYRDDEIKRMPLDALEHDWRAASVRIWPLSFFAKRATRKRLQTYVETGKADPRTDLAALRILQAELIALAESPLSVLPVFDGVNTDLAVVQTYLAHAIELRGAVGELTRLGADKTVLQAVLGPLLKASGDQTPVAGAARDFSSSKTAFDAARDDFSVHAGAVPEMESLGGLRDELDALQAESGRLSDWTKWVAVRKQALARGLGPLIEVLESNPMTDATEAFRTAYWNWWLPLALDASPELRGFAHWEQSHRIERFRALDDAAQRIAAAQVRRALAHDLPARDGVARKSELGVLRHQLGLQRPSVSIRQLIGQMPETFTRLAPCVLMSPLSVAQYLPSDQAQFDLIIFDEASQITTWDAVGAIARGLQSVIAGDPKQLPPTNFFGRSDDETEADLEVYEKDLPSILDEAAASGMPTHQLNWHYRSRDEALIAFSNHHYYGNRLITFPSPRTQSEALVFHKVDGVYARGSGRTNEIEARAIVKLTVERLSEWLEQPEAERPTLGVITFNAQQQELILDLLDAARRETPALEWFFEDDREEPVIVKNLENIQGDERDLMLFSITFGPDQAGKLTMNFGAVNGDGGEKRLNVAVTRARAELHVFASILADQIDLSRTKALGVAHLKNFLDYAARGAVALPAMDQGSLGPAESPFEESVAEALAARGWEVRTQIGVSGFRIDLGVVHPDRAGAFLAGVECDGATYHSSASARDRDRIREEVLRNLGWEIVRIWSTDWFTHPVEALERADSTLRALLQASRERAAAEQQVLSDQAEEARTASSSAFGANAEREGAAAVDADSGANAVPSIGPVTRSATTVGEIEDLPERLRIATLAASRSERGEVVGPETADTVAPLSTPKPTPDPDPAPDPVPDPDRFYEPDYGPVLEEIVFRVVQREGPIRDDRLVRLVCRQHGWQRAGRRIRARILGCLGANEAHDEDGQLFIWAPGTHRPEIAFREGLDRSLWELSRAELFGLISAHPEVTASDDPARELARLIGIARLTDEARSHLDACLSRHARFAGSGDDKSVAEASR